MTKIESIPESQLMALMDLILEKAAEAQKEKRRTHEVTDAQDGSPKPSPFLTEEKEIYERN